MPVNDDEIKAIMHERAIKRNELQVKRMLEKMDSLKKFGKLIDELENISCALTVPFPDSFNVEALKELLPEKVKKLKELFIEISGENPWE